MLTWVKRFLWRFRKQTRGIISLFLALTLLPFSSIAILITESARYQNAAELISDLKRSLITPDKDFVNLVDPDEEGATRVACEDELNDVKKSGRVPDTEQMRLKDDVLREYDKDDRYDDYDRERRPRRRDYEDDDDLYEYDRDNRRRSSTPQQGNMEKITIAMAIVSALQHIKFEA